MTCWMGGFFSCERSLLKPMVAKSTFTSSLSYIKTFSFWKSVTYYKCEFLSRKKIELTLNCILCAIRMKSCSCICSALKSAYSMGMSMSVSSLSSGCASDVIY